MSPKNYHLPFDSNWNMWDMNKDDLQRMQLCMRWFLFMPFVKEHIRLYNIDKHLACATNFESSWRMALSALSSTICHLMPSCFCVSLIMHSNFGAHKVPRLIKTRAATKNAAMAYLNSITPLDIFEHAHCTSLVKEAHVLHSYQVKHGGDVQQTA